MTNIPMTMVLQTTQDVRYLGSLRSEVTFIVATSELNMFCDIFANTGEFLWNFLKSQLGNGFCQHFFHLIASQVSFNAVIIIFTDAWEKGVIINQIPMIFDFYEVLC